MKADSQEEPSSQSAGVSSAPATATASTSTSTQDCSKDATVAQCFHAAQQLTTIFQFTPTQAQDAIDAVGPDVTLAYNYILDNGGADRGGTIIPKDDCPHLAGGVLLDHANDFKYQNVCRHFMDESSKGGMKGEVVDGGGCPSGENWLCLQCGAVRCSRYVNGHCKEHWENTKADDAKEGKGGDCVGHCVAVSLEDLSVWCYECSAYLNHPSLSPVLKRLEMEKFSGDEEGESK